MSTESADRAKVVMFTDGACSGNPGPGGWGVILVSGAHRKELTGGEPDTTNNRMELLAAINGLEALKKPSLVELHTDSMYLRDGITKWVHGWKRNGWKTADKKPVKNVELWQRLLLAVAPEVYAEFVTRLDAPATPNASLRKTLQTPPPWDKT